MRRSGDAVLLALACALWAGRGAAGEAPDVARALLEVGQPPRVEGAGEVGAGGRLRLRAVDPGRLEVRLGGRVVAACHLGWGEDERLRVLAVEPREDEEAPPALPRVVDARPGREEVEVALPEEVEEGEEWLEVEYAWEWRYEGRPALRRRWRRVESEAQARWRAQAQAFEEEFPLGVGEEARARGEEPGQEVAEEPGWQWEPEDESPRVQAHKPEVLRVGARATRAQLAEQLFGDREAQGAFDFEACEAPGEAMDGALACVRVRRVEALLPPWRAQVKRALETLLEEEAAWLARWQPEDTQALAEKSLAWAQRAEVKDEQGVGYFDRYLALMADRRVEREGESEWDFLGEDSEPLKKAVALRAVHWKTGYRVTDGVPELKPGDLLGRCYFTGGVPTRRTSVAVRVLRLWVEERSEARAEIKLRNGPWRGPRALVPGKDGRFRGYAVHLVNLTETESFEQQETRCYGYYAGTRFIRPGEWRPEVEGRGDGVETLRRLLLGRALGKATAQAPEELLGLDHEVLQLLTAEQRQQLLKTVLAGPALTSTLAEDVVELLERVVRSTPEKHFPALEEALTRPEVLQRLLSLEGPQQARLGQAFTQKALAAAPLPLGDFEALPSLHLGREGEVRHLLDVPLEQGEAGETLLRFKPVRLRYEARYFATPEQEPPGPALRAREWVRVEVHGEGPQTRLMTALELALSASGAGNGLVLEAVGRVGEAHLLHGGMAALARAPLGTLVPGSAEAAARRWAVRTFLGRVGLVGLMATVDTHREELSRTREGRAFLAVHDVALLALAARDVSRLATSGLLEGWARQAGVVLGGLGPQATAGLREALETAQALARAARKVLSEGRLVATGEGLTFRAPEGARALRHAWFSVRAEAAGQRLVEGLRRAQALTPQVERTLEALKQLGEQSEQWAQAWSAVARRAAGLSAQEARKYLEAVESLRKGTRPEAQAAVAKLLYGSGSSKFKDPNLFLKEAEWLVHRPGLDEEALTALASKASKDRIDLRWLGTTDLTAEDLNFLGRDDNTPWKLLQEASEAPSDLWLQLQARARLRGIAGEMEMGRSARRLVPGYEVSGRQVRMEDGHIIDFELEAADGTLRRALEVKGWTADTWRRALKAWFRRASGLKLDAQETRLVRQLKDLAEQLRDAAHDPRGKPFLVHTDKLSLSAREGLDTFLDAQHLKVDTVMMEELEMMATTRRLRAAFKLPEQLPGKKAGGAP